GHRGSASIQADRDQLGNADARAPETRHGGYEQCNRGVPPPSVGRADGALPPATAALAAGSPFGLAQPRTNFRPAVLARARLVKLLVPAAQLQNRPVAVAQQRPLAPALVLPDADVLEEAG